MPKAQYQLSAALSKWNETYIGGKQKGKGAFTARR
jgi:hypothetical protein